MRREKLYAERCFNYDTEPEVFFFGRVTMTRRGEEDFAVKMCGGFFFSFFFGGGG